MTWETLAWSDYETMAWADWETLPWVAAAPSVGIKRASIRLPSVGLSMKRKF